MAGLLLLLFFQPSGRLAFVKIYNFLQVVVILKNAVLWVSFVQMRSFRPKARYGLPPPQGEFCRP